LQSFAGSRIYDIAIMLQTYSQDWIMQYPALVAKAAILLFGISLRPHGILSLPFDLLNFGYTFLSLSYIPANLSLILTLANKDVYESLKNESNGFSAVHFFTVLSIFIVVANPIITFRYIFPYMPFSFAMLGHHNYLVRSRIILPSLFIISIIATLSPLWSVENVGEPYGVVIPDFMSWL
jgi:hypothetical protein